MRPQPEAGAVQHTFDLRLARVEPRGNVFDGIRKIISPQKRVARLAGQALQIGADRLCEKTQVCGFVRLFPAADALGKLIQRERIFRRSAFLRGAAG